MRAKYFIDTNIFVYAFDTENPPKAQTARQIIADALKNRNGCISYQVIQEFTNVALRKFKIPLTLGDCRQFLRKVLLPLCQVHSNTELFEDSLNIKESGSYSYYDTLIVAAARQAQCTILISEDFQHGQKIGNLVVQNPFV